MNMQRKVGKKRRHYSGLLAFRRTTERKEEQPTVDQSIRTNFNDYRQKYVRDEPGMEMGPDARVWKVYNDEADQYDREMLDGWHETLNVLLTFAGLFSAVVTTFIVASTLSLQPDYTQLTYDRINTLVEIQLAISLGQPLPSLSSTPPPFSPDLSDVWINALWFINLSFSLIAALLAVLAKQWLLHYSKSIAGSTKHRALLRQFRFNGLTDWGVPAIIGILPYFLHIALLIFLVGLCLFVKALHQDLFFMVLTITATTFAVFILSHLLAVLFPSCPYKNPIVNYLYPIFSLLLRVMDELLYDFIPKADHETNHLLRIMAYILRDRYLETGTGKYALEGRGTLMGDALLWLSAEASNPSVQQIVVFAPAGLPPGFSPHVYERIFWGLWSQIDKTMKTIQKTDVEVEGEFGNHLADRVMRVAFNEPTSDEWLLVRALCSLYPSSKYHFNDSGFMNDAVSNIMDAPSAVQPDLIITVACILAAREENRDKRAQFLQQVYPQILRNIAVGSHSALWIPMFRAIFDMTIFSSQFGSDAFGVAIYLLDQVFRSTRSKERDVGEELGMELFEDACCKPHLRSMVVPCAAALIHPNAAYIFSRNVRNSSASNLIEMRKQLRTVLEWAVEHGHPDKDSSPWNFLLSLDMINSGRDDTCKYVVLAFYFALGEEGTFDDLYKDDSTVAFRPTFLHYASINILLARWLTQGFSKKNVVALHDAQIELILGHCRKTLGYSEFRNRSDLVLEVCGAIATIFRHLKDHPTVWSITMDEIVFALYKRLVELKSDRNIWIFFWPSDVNVELMSFFCAAGLHYWLFHPVTTTSQWTNRLLHTLSISKWGGKPFERVYLNLLYLFHGSFYQTRLNNAQRRLGAGYISDIRQFLSTNCNTKNLPTAIYIYEGDDLRPEHRRLYIPQGADFEAKKYLPPPDSEGL